MVERALRLYLVGRDHCPYSAPRTPSADLSEEMAVDDLASSSSLSEESRDSMQGEE